MQEKIFDMLLEQEEIGWKTLIYDLVKTEQMDPWDLNITLLTQRYIQVIKEMKEHDLRISGKILLAAAILLKMKSAHLIDHDISRLDSLLNQNDEEEFDEDLFEELASGERKLREKYKLIPRNPQPRTRKVSMQDLIDALQKAMASKKRILARQRPVKFVHPKKGLDILEVIREVYHKIVYYDKKDKKTLTFSKLLPPKAGKREKVHTFIPLLHLDNQRQIETTQKNHFDEIYIKLLGKRAK
ncbi:MAG: segregation/condensation protein A [Nanoarchaeota archaeon]|nr:segregation/condensation protein A [Nanoarchaeota archaeon]MBU1622404.1 segregation/condensation protein A [Nanoarchaeota archaeon]